MVRRLLDAERSPNPTSHTSSLATHLWTSAPRSASKPRLSTVDLSGLIFVALAVAWAVYLIPKALKHHDDVVRSRSVDRFSSTMRVLARREPVSRRNARLVVTPGRPAAQVEVAVKGEPVVATLTRRTRRQPRAPAVVAGCCCFSSCSTSRSSRWPRPGVIDWCLGRLPVGAARRLAGRLPADGQARARRAAGAWSSQVAEALTEEPADRSTRLDADTDSMLAVDDAADRPGAVGPGARHPADLRLQAGRAPQRAHHRPRRHRRVDLGPQRGRQPARPRRRGGRAHRARARRPPATSATAPSAPDPRHGPADRSVIRPGLGPVLAFRFASPGRIGARHLGLWRSW